MPDRMSDRISKYLPERMSDSQNKYAICTSRWYVRSYVRIMFHGGGHSKKTFVFVPKVKPGATIQTRVYCCWNQQLCHSNPSSAERIGAYCNLSSGWLNLYLLVTSYNLKLFVACLMSWIEPQLLLVKSCKIPCSKASCTIGVLALLGYKSDSVGSNELLLNGCFLGICSLSAKIQIPQFYWANNFVLLVECICLFLGKSTLGEGITTSPCRHHRLSLVTVRVGKRPSNLTLLQVSECLSFTQIVNQPIQSIVDGLNFSWLNQLKNTFFPTCQVRVYRFDQELLPSPPSARCQIECLKMPQRMPDRMSVYITYISLYTIPDSQIKCQTECQIERQMECQNMHMLAGITRRRQFHFSGFPSCFWWFKCIKNHPFQGDILTHGGL